MATPPYTHPTYTHTRHARCIMSAARCHCPSFFYKVQSDHVAHFFQMVSASHHTPQTASMSYTGGQASSCG